MWLLLGEAYTTLFLSLFQLTCREFCNEFIDLFDLYQELKVELEYPVKARSPDYLRNRLIEIAQEAYDQSKEVRVLQKRIQQFESELLTCLNYEGVLPENNTAERTLRPQVIKRKIFGSIRSLEGAITHEVNSSVITTYQNLGGNFFEVILPILRMRAGAVA